MQQCLIVSCKEQVVKMLVNSAGGSFPPDFHICGYDLEDNNVETQLSKPLAIAFEEINKYDPVYTEMVKVRKEQSSFLTARQCKMALETILATAVLEKEIPTIKKISSEKLRNEEIAKKTFLLAEEGFSKGVNENEVEVTLKGWINTLKNSYNDHLS